jgi:outer membrane protein assembly factor BamB
MSTTPFGFRFARRDRAGDGDPRDEYFGTRTSFASPPEPAITSASAPAGMHRALAVAGALVLLVGTLTLLVEKTPSAKAGADTPEAVSVAYQVDPAHDGDQPNESLPNDIAEKWSENLPGAVSYPLIVGDRVFVTASNSNTGNSSLYGFDASDGQLLWGPVDLQGIGEGIAYDDGLVFNIDFSGTLTAYDAVTGVLQWTQPLQDTGQYMFTSAPSASGGVAYVGGSGSGGTLYAVDENTGQLLWTGSVANGDESSPAVSASGVYVSYACQQTYDFSPTSGALMWHYSPDWGGGGGQTPVLYDGSLYVPDNYPAAPPVLSATTGAQTGTFGSVISPAFDNSLEFSLDNGTLTATQLSTGTTLWTQRADGTLDMAPIVVGGKVYVGGSSGLVAAFDENTGAETWSAKAGSPIAPAGVISGLGAGDNLLVVPATDSLVVYGSSDPSATPSPVGQITGTITDAYGNPISGIYVSAAPESSGASALTLIRSGTDGSFDFDQLLPGSYAIEFQYCPVSEAVCHTQYYDGVSSVSDETDIDVTANSVVSDVDVTFVLPGQDSAPPPAPPASTGSPSSATTPPATTTTPATPSQPVAPVTVPTPTAETGSGSSTSTSSATGYVMVASDGGIFTFGDAGYYGSEGGTQLTKPIVGMAATPDGKGYWLVASDGGIFTFGDAGYYGSEGGTQLTKPIVGMAATPDGKGYWLVASDGGVFSFGDAGYYGSQGGKLLADPIVGMASTHDGKGYWLVASDGGIFSFGDAGYYGSQGGKPLTKPIVGMAAAPDGKGYWLVASDGGIFTFGDAGYFGSQGDAPLNAPIGSMAVTPDGKGYWLVASDGGIFTFGDAGYYGSQGGKPLNKPIVGMAVG